PGHPPAPPPFPPRRSSDLFRRSSPPTNSVSKRDVYGYRSHASVRTAATTWPVELGRARRRHHDRFRNLSLAGRHRAARAEPVDRSEEHTSELQSPYELVCR